MRELKKGNKAPWRGYLLNVGEYNRMKNHEKLLEELIDYFEDTKGNKRCRTVLN